MKKILMSLMVIVILGISNANAGENIFKQANEHGDSMSSVQMGYVVDGTMQVGIDAMTNTSDNAFSFGVGGEYVGIDVPRTAVQTYGSVYNLGAELKIGYNLDNILSIPVRLKAGVGYGVTRLDTINEWNAIYSASAETQLYKKVGVGIRYKGLENKYTDNQAIIYALYSF